MRPIALTLALTLAASPAQACHRFSVWHYRFPQRCGVYSRSLNETAKPAAAVEDRSWYVEITKMPTLDDRAAGIEALKGLMK